MSAGVDLDRELVEERGAAPVALDRHRGERREGVELCDGARQRLQARRFGRQRCKELVVQPPLERERALLRR